MENNCSTTQDYYIYGQSPSLITFPSYYLLNHFKITSGLIIFRDGEQSPTSSIKEFSLKTKKVFFTIMGYFFIFFIKMGFV